MFARILAGVLLIMSLSLAAGAPEFGKLPAFLLRAYNLKAVADYETGPDSEIPPQRAVTAAEDADRFVAIIRNALSA